MCSNLHWFKVFNIVSDIKLYLNIYFMNQLWLYFVDNNEWININSICNSLLEVKDLYLNYLCCYHHWQIHNFFCSWDISHFIHVKIYNFASICTKNSDIIGATVSGSVIWTSWSASIQWNFTFLHFFTWSIATSIVCICGDDRLHRITRYGHVMGYNR